MKKHIFLVISLFLVSNVSAQTIFYANGLSQESVKDKKVLFAWDLNEVIFDAKKSVLAKPKNWKNAISMRKMHFKKKKYKKQGKDEGYVFEQTIRHCKPKKIDKYFDLMAKMMDPNQNVVNILSQLKAKGHNHAILSNMGETIWAKIKEKNRLNVQSFFTTHHNCVAHKRPNGTWYHKPDADYFQLFVSLNKPLIDTINIKVSATDTYVTETISYGQKKDDTLIVFIDDDKHGCHIPAALRNGIDVAIKFENHKQLRTDLQSLGLL